MIFCGTLILIIPRIPNRSLNGRVQMRASIPPSVIYNFENTFFFLMGNLHSPGFPHDHEQQQIIEKSY